jgi:hypothetical protein
MRDLPVVLLIVRSHAPTTKTALRDRFSRLLVVLTVDSAARLIGTEVSAWVIAENTAQRRAHCCRSEVIDSLTLAEKATGKVAF